MSGPGHSIGGKALQGRTGASARFPAREPKQRRCRRSAAEPHAPTGLSPQVTGGGQTGFLEGPNRAAPERQLGFLQGNRSSAGAGGAKRSRMPRRGCHRQVTGGGQTGFLSERALQGRTGASARFPVWKPKQRRCRRSEAEPHAPTGLSPQVTGGGQTEFLEGPSGPHRSVS